MIIDLDNGTISVGGRNVANTFQTIESNIQNNYYTKEDTDTKITETQTSIETTNNRITVAINETREDYNNKISDIAYYIRYQNGVVIVGRTDSPYDFRIANDRISACYGGEPTSYWDQNEQRTPKQLYIPLGGSFRNGNFLWQPRTSGNLSLFWVGG